MIRGAPAGLRGRSCGFTLIEVLVAFAIFALTVGALFELFAGAARRGAQAQQIELDWLTAQSLLSELRVRAAPWDPESGGRTLAGRSWQIGVTPFDAGADPASAWKAYQVTVRVSHDGGRGQVEISSIELARSNP